MSLKHYPSYYCMVGWFCFKLIWVLLPQMSWIDLGFLAWVHLGFVVAVWLGFGGCGWLVVADGWSWGIWSLDGFQCLVTSKVEEKKKRIRDDLFWMYCVIGWQESERKKVFFLIFNIFLGEVTFFFFNYNFLILFYKPCHL